MNHEDRRPPPVAASGRPPQPPRGGAPGGADWAQTLARGRRLLRRHARLVAAALGGSLLVAVAVSAAMTPLYRSQALLQVSDWRPPVATAPKAPGDDEPAAMAEQLLHSTQLAQPVARELQLARYPEYGPAGAHWGRLRRRVGAALAAGAAGLGSWAWRARPKRAAAPRAGPLAPRTAAVSAAPPPPRLRASGIGESAASPAHAADSSPSDDPVTDQLLRRLTVARRPGGSLIELSGEDADPVLAPAIVNGLVRELQRQMTQAQQGYVTAGESFLDRQLAATHQAWRAAQDALLQFRNRHAADAAGPEQSAAMARLMALAEAVTRAEIDLWQQRATLAAGRAEGRLSETEQRQWAELRLRRAELAAQESRLAAQYGPAALPLVQARRALASVDASLAQLRRATLAGHRVSARADEWQLGRLKAAVAQEETLIAAAEQNAAQDQLLAAEAQGQQTLFASLWQQRKQLEVTAGLMQNPVQVLAPARIALRPARPNWSMNLGVGLLAGLLVAVLAMAAAEAQAGDRVGGDNLPALRLPVLAAWPHLPNAALHHATLRAAGLAALAGLPAEFRRAVDSLFVSLLLGAQDHACCVLVTSALPHEGKSTVVAWLAHALAQAGGAVLAIDCHGAAPGLTLQLAARPAPGLAGYCAGDCGLQELFAAAAGRDGAPAVIAAGAPDAKLPAAQLAGPAMRRLLEEARRRFDWILLDAGAVLAAPEVRLLAAQADATLLVAGEGQLRQAQLAAAETLLRHSGAEWLGLVLNAAPPLPRASASATPPQALPPSRPAPRAQAATANR